MPIADTFWAHRFGMCTDRFGTLWMVNCEKPIITHTGGNGYRDPRNFMVTRRSVERRR
jgi:hypothetical protein